ncbi:hypothetical protein BAY61_18715 [Prauserella marina]|uniref:Uncharacterized protein n=1 Tax=Prauserella marina TaxID=530584 RepID=A0A222VS22_9PSEU|nr:hypothetical protein [Prauserella marina]ASR36699.1 hypothetical protein BAY61_18715 [Prauserella marina]PWV80432.1 hypothetical protein DES30_103524 [Prauserella marina]SDD54163.1 hypothetical protein SAMN05421630_109309 [Prauserella marina]
MRTAGRPARAATADGLAFRDPSELMQPRRLAAMQPTRLSASRSLIEKMTRERWNIELSTMDVTDAGDGVAVYRVDTGSDVFSFAAFSSEPRMVDRTPRIIGQSWDMVGALWEGEADAGRIEQTRRELPKLYAGRAAAGTLVWCRSNRSLRAFEHTVRALADGRQPDLDVLRDIGYLMRNTGLDANGTFGTRTFISYGDRHPLRVPYHAQMLTAYLMREFSADLCERLARGVSSRAVPLAPEYRRYLGLGNGSALGLVLFVANHPRLVDRWLTLRERALLAARELDPPRGDPRYDTLLGLLARAITYRRQDPMTYNVFPASDQVAAELNHVRDLVHRLREGERFAGPEVPAFEQLRRELAGTVTAETEETLDAVLIEFVPEECVRLTEELLVDEQLVREPGMTIGELRTVLDEQYRWALELPIADERDRRRIWYKSRSSEEPRSGPREEVPGGFDLSVDVPGLARALRTKLDNYDPGHRVGRFLFDNPEQLAAVERFQALRDNPCAQPYVDALDVDFVPARLIRLMNGALYGLDRTKDYLNRTLRGLIFQGAPTRQDIAGGNDDVWWWPAEPGTRGTEGDRA